ncbi:MAG: hypothetical protein M1127_03110 [Patescibacteria group bacterium]|nr:hypothetical protein [Patescibacteria group bacterium]
MPVAVQKQGRETSQNVLRRFSQRIRKSGLVLEVRARQFKRKKKSGPLQKRSALRRQAKKAEYLLKAKMCK